MKTKKALALALTLILAVSAFALTACGDSSSGIDGTYELNSAEADGIKLDKSDLDAFGLSMTLKLTKDGKASLAYDGEVSTGTYKIDGTKFLLKDGEDTIEGTISSDKKTITIIEPESNVKMVLIKV